MSDRHGLRPDLLRAFIAVHETGGFTRAGKRLHLSQSAVSHQIRRLEEQAGTALLKRTTRSLTLTEDGEEFLRHAEQILRAQDALAIRFQRSAVTGAVRFGVPESYVGDRLPPMLARFAPVPAVRLDATVDTYLALRDQIDAGLLDLAVTLSLDEDPASPLLRRTRFVWAAGRGSMWPRMRRCPWPWRRNPVCTGRWRHARWKRRGVNGGLPSRRSVSKGCARR